MKKIVLVAIAVSGILYSCSTAANTASSVLNTFSLPATAENIAQGKTIYENNCAKCHALPDPKKYSDEKWVGIMNWMAPKAKLDDNQKALAYVYASNSN